ncbi:phosphate transport system ATP-binding protein [Dysgonomonadaceae bacterium PH5-43]|nr:phosphate transport system ATP-binding protein [Dysgonomonadaceae bacterium PH5-43]
MGKENHITQSILEIKNLNVYSSITNKHIIKDLSLSIAPNTVTTVIGSPMSGKSILLKAINRLNDLQNDIKSKGEIYFKQENINNINIVELRQKIGFVFKDPQVFPHLSIFDNVISGYTLNRVRLSKDEKNYIVERCLNDVALWDNLKDDLNKKPDFLTKGEQQRLCIARAIALNPEVILMEEPTSFMSAYCTNKIEEMIHKYKENTTIIISTSKLSQAARLSDFALYLENGELIEHNETSKLLWHPKDKRTEKFIINQID